MNRHTIITSLIAASVVVFWAVIGLNLRNIHLHPRVRERVFIKTQATDLLLCYADERCAHHDMSPKLKNTLITEWECAGRPWAAHIAENVEDSTAMAKRIVAVALHYIELMGMRELRHEAHSDSHIFELRVRHNMHRSIRLHFIRQQDTLELERIEGLCTLLQAGISSLGIKH